MSMDWQTFQDALKAWVVAQLPTASVEWQKEAHGWSAKTRARLNVFSSTSRGVDELRYVFDGDEPAGADYQPTVSGVREFVFSVLVESRDQRPTGAARWYLEKLRTSIQKPSVKAAFLAAGIAFQSSETVVPLDIALDDRVESRASLEFRFGAAVNEEDTAEVGSYVETAGVAATLTQPDEETDSGWTEESFGN